MNIKKITLTTFLITSTFVFGELASARRYYRHSFHSSSRHSYLNKSEKTSNQLSSSELTDKCAEKQKELFVVATRGLEKALESSYERLTMANYLDAIIKDQEADPNPAKIQEIINFSKRDYAGVIKIALDNLDFVRKNLDIRNFCYKNLRDSDVKFIEKTIEDAKKWAQIKPK